MVLSLVGVNGFSVSKISERIDEDSSAREESGWEMNEAPLAFLASRIPVALSMIRGIIESVISISEDNAYAYLPKTWESAEPSERESSSGIVVSVRSTDASTMARNATAEAADDMKSDEWQYADNHMMAASTMKKLLSLRYLFHGRCIIMAAMTGMTASENTSYRSAEDITAEYERSPTSFAFGFMRVRMLSSFL